MTWSHAQRRAAANFLNMARAEADEDASRDQIMAMALFRWSQATQRQADADAERRQRERRQRVGDFLSAADESAERKEKRLDLKNAERGPRAPILTPYCHPDGMIRRPERHKEDARVNQPPTHVDTAFIDRLAEAIQ
jgi:hypothetical protein